MDSHFPCCPGYHHAVGVVGVDIFQPPLFALVSTRAMLGIAVEFGALRSHLDVHCFSPARYHNAADRNLQENAKFSPHQWSRMHSANRAAWSLAVFSVSSLFLPVRVVTVARMAC